MAITAGAQQIAWSVEAPGAGSLLAPAIGPDGTVYAVNGHLLHAVTPDGNVLWSLPAADGQVAVGAGGVVYASTGKGVQAVRPDGSVKWIFETEWNIVGGPAVGPGGLIYAVEDAQFDGTGMFALDADGGLAWENRGDPAISDHGGLPHRIAFQGERIFVSMKPARGTQPPNFWAFDPAGKQVYTLTTECNSQPVLDPVSGNLILGNGLCQEIRSHDSQTGNLMWSEPAPSASPCSGMAQAAVGPDGNIYTAFCYRAFWSLTDSGVERWFVDDFDTIFQMARLGVAPDNSVVLDLGWDPSTSAGRVRAWDPADGSHQWELSLQGTGATATTTPVFDQLRRRVYFNAQNAAAGLSYLYAVDLAGCPADCDGSGALDFFDFLCFQNLFGAGDPRADCDGSGALDFFDFLCFQNLFGAGCI